MMTGICMYKTIYPSWVYQSSSLSLIIHHAPKELSFPPSFLLDGEYDDGAREAFFPYDNDNDTIPYDNDIVSV